MNTSRHAISLLARCSTAVRPKFPHSSSHLNRCLAARGQRRPYSSNDSPKDYDSLPSLPITNPIAFSMELTSRNFSQIHWCLTEQGLEKDIILTTNNSAEQVLKFITKCIAEGDFGTLDEKLTPEAISKAQSIVAALNSETKNDLAFPGSRLNLSFDMELCHFSPWNFALEDNNLILTFLGFLVNSKAQRLWLMTLSIPKEGESTISDDFKVKKFDYSVYLTPKQE